MTAWYYRQHLGDTAVVVVTIEDQLVGTRLVLPFTIEFSVWRGHGRYAGLITDKQEIRARTN